MYSSAHFKKYMSEQKFPRMRTCDVLRGLIIDVNELFKIEHAKMKCMDTQIAQNDLDMPRIS